MGKLALEAAELIRMIAGAGIAVLTGTIGVVDAEAMTATVTLTINAGEVESSTTDGVLLNTTLNNTAGICLVPKDGADCEVAQLDGPGQWSVIRASEYDKVMITVGDMKLTIVNGEIMFNDGSNGGLTITPTLVIELNKNNLLLQAIMTVINGAPIPEPGSGAASALQAILKTAITGLALGDFSSIENTNVKH